MRQRSAATLRVYLERFESDATQHGRDTQAVLGDLAHAADAIAGIRAQLGREQPSVVT